MHVIITSWGILCVVSIINCIVQTAIVLHRVSIK